MNITNEIAEAIQRNLPAAVGEELQAVLAKAKTDAEALETLQRKLTASEKEVQILRAEGDRLVEKLRRHEDLAKREAAVVERERLQEVFELKAQLAATQQVAEHSMQITKDLVRNTEYRRTLANSETQYLPTGSGGYPQQFTSNNGSTESRSAV
jgi:hypothetical protein